MTELMLKKMKKNPDFERIKWNQDYVKVTYTYNKQQETCSLREYYNSTMKPKPPIDKFEVLPVSENVIELLKHYDTNVKLNTFKFEHDIYINNKLNQDIDLESIIIKSYQRTIKHGNKISKIDITDSIIDISKDNKYNPISEYLKKCHRYYNKNHDKDIFKKLCNTIETTSKFKELYISKFLLQMVYLACSDTKEDTPPALNLILLGKQSIGKSTWLKNLLPKDLQNDYFIERHLDLNSPAARDSIAQATTNWLVELGEITATFKKSELNALKQFLTAPKDKFRLPYAREAITRKRRCSFCGTTNNLEFLADLTGNRRYAVLECLSIDIETKIDIDMLWGYFYNLYLMKKPYYFNKAETIELEIENKKYLIKSEKMLFLEQYFDLSPNTENIEEEEFLSAKFIFSKIKDNIDNPFKKHTLGRELKKFNVLCRYNKHKKIDEFFIKYIGE
jgi:predicted P-loop ATPase